MGINKQDSGHVLLNDEKLVIPYSKNVRRKIGYLPDEPILTNLLSGIENLSYMNHVYDSPKTQNELISILNENGL